MSDTCNSISISHWYFNLSTSSLSPIDKRLSMILFQGSENGLTSQTTPFCEDARCILPIGIFLTLYIDLNNSHVPT